jgi:hypothetical protein
MGAQEHAREGFTDDYNVVRSLSYQVYRNPDYALAREKQLKDWRREKKNRLVESMNPTWRDLAADWYKPQGPSTPLSLRERSAQDELVLRGLLTRSVQGIDRSKAKKLRTR